MITKEPDKNIIEKIQTMGEKMQAEEYVLSLDIGKFETKAIGRIIDGSVENLKRVNFRTKVYNLSEGYIDVEGNSYKIEFEGKEYIIGEQGERKSNETSKTNLLHKLSAYTAITRFLKADTYSKVHIVLACPLSVLKIGEAKEEYKNFIKGKGEIKVKVNDENFRFEIENVTIKAEGSGILFKDPQMFKNKNVAVVDFGGLNMGFSLYRNGVCKQNDRFIEEFAANELILRVKDAMTSLNKGNLISYDEAEQALEKGCMTELGNIISESSSRINEVKEKFLNEAVEIIKTNGYKLEQFDTIVFVGGTTQHLKQHILNKYPNAVIPQNSKWSTAEGLYKVACAKYSK